ncbi:MAG: DUF1266 domain-containing protein [Defluviitaleaceae bacterium]|nr:DUF1266 domain-containing protein [Defluviitaleaceae bacterium]
MEILNKDKLWLRIILSSIVSVLFIALVEFGFEVELNIYLIMLIWVAFIIIFCIDTKKLSRKIIINAISEENLEREKDKEITRTYTWQDMLKYKRRNIEILTRDLPNLLTSDVIQKHEKKYKLSEKRNKALILGGVLTTQNQQSCRVLPWFFNHSYDLDMDSDTLEQYWGIVNEQTAIDSLNKLSTYSENIRQLNNMYKRMVQNDTLNQNDSYKKAYNFLKSVGIKETNIKMVKQMDAWNYGRGVWLAQSCFNLDYISEKEAWQYIENMADKAYGMYTSFEEFWAAYFIGRALNYDGDTLHIFHDNLKYLLYHKQSPVKEVRF